MSVVGRLRSKETQFYVELLYGLLFVGGFAFLAVRVDPRVAAFEGGLVVGYLLRVWEKMSIYERVIEESVSEEAQTQVADEVERQFDEEVDDRVGRAVEEQVERELDDLDERIDDRVAESIEEADERNGSEPSTA